MNKARISKQFEILGLKILVSVSYTKPLKQPKIALPFFIRDNSIFIAIVFLLIVISGYGLKMVFNNTVYATESTPFLFKISPVLSQIDENNVPTPPTFADKVVLHGSSDSKQIALTFDADMTPLMKYFLDSGEVKSYYNQQLIDILNQTQTKATLFLTGMWIEAYPKEARELATNPLFELGNHSYSHPSFSGNCFGLAQISDSEDKEEIEKTQSLLKNLTGFDNKYFRFPGGCYSSKNLDIATSEGLTVVHWDVAGQDGFNNDPQNIEKNALDNVKNGSIIVLHMNGFPNSPKTADALPKIISTLKQKGFAFVKVSELLNEPKIEAINIRGFLNKEYGL